MSRSAVRSRADRQTATRGSRSPAQSASAAAGPLPAGGSAQPGPQETDPEGTSVRGALTQAHWTLMLAREEAEETVGLWVEELLHEVLERCYQSYTHTQVVPFCVWWTRQRVVQLLEWQFLHGAEPGEEPDEDPDEDLEPPPATTDSWAQGCVPVARCTKGTRDPPTVAHCSQPLAHPPKHKQILALTPLVPVSSQTDRSRAGKHQRVTSSSVQQGGDRSSHRVPLTPTPPPTSTHRVALTPTPPPTPTHRVALTPTPPPKRPGRQIVWTPRATPPPAASTARRGDQEDQNDLPSAPPARRSSPLWKNTAPPPPRRLASL